MAHETYELDNNAFAFNPAWHRLGTTFDRFLSGEDVKEETSVGAYNVYQARAHVPIDRITKRAIDLSQTPDVNPNNVLWVPTEAMMNYRDDLDATDPRALLSPTGVGEGYSIVQNRELVDIVSGAIDSEFGAQFETAGTLRNGKLVWLLAKCPESTDVGNDKLNRYVLAYSSHDGSRAITIAATHVRVVCWNTLSAALAGNQSNRFDLRHTSGVRDRIALAIDACKAARRHFDAEAQLYGRMSKVSVSRRFVKAYLEALYPNPADGGKTNKVEAKRGRIATLLSTQPGARRSELWNSDTDEPTQWGLYNAVTQYWQHESTSRVKGLSKDDPNADQIRAEHRFAQNALGGNQERQRGFALETLLDSDNLLEQASAALATN